MSQFVQDEAEERNSDSTTSSLTDLTSSVSGETIRSSTSSDNSDEEAESATDNSATEDVPTFVADDDEDIEMEQLPERDGHALSDNDSAEFTDNRCRDSDEDSTATSQLSLHSLSRRGRIRPQVLRRSARIRDMEQQRLKEAQARQEKKRKRIADGRRRRFRLSDSEESEYQPPSKQVPDEDKGASTGKGSRKKSKIIDVAQPRRTIPDTAAGRIESEFEIEWLDGRFKKVRSELGIGRSKYCPSAILYSSNSLLLQIVIYRERAPPMGIGSSSRLRLTPPPGSGTEGDPFLVTDTGSVVDPDAAADADDEYEHDEDGYDVDAGAAQRATLPTSPARSTDGQDVHPFPSLLMYESD
ncbi:hypothetical protein CF326_g4403 [Tilletia indica]|nr:hypothetical protein CF326_g4403 [Tilletia indica]